MNRLFLTTILAVVLGCGAAPGAPQLKFDSLVYDFGTTGQVPTVKGTFTFQNAGDTELEVRPPKPSCGCTVVAVKPDKLAPGDKGELSFTLNIGRGRGPMIKYITVPSNDPQQPQMKLTLKVTIQPTFDVRPPTVLVQGLAINDTTNVEVMVTRVDGQALEFKKLVPSSEMIQARAEPGPEGPNPSARIVLEIKGIGAPRRLNERLTILTGDDGAPELIIPVLGEVVGDVKVMPERLVWGVGNFNRLPAARLKGAMTRQVVITSTKADQRLEIKSAVSDLKDLSVEVAPIQDGKTYKITAELTRQPTASEKGSITVETNLPQQPTIVIPVVVHVLNRP